MNTFVGENHLFRSYLGSQHVFQICVTSDLVTLSSCSAECIEVDSWTLQMWRRLLALTREKHCVHHGFNLNPRVLTHRKRTEIWHVLKTDKLNACLCFSAYIIQEKKNQPGIMNAKPRYYSSLWCCSITYISESLCRSYFYMCFWRQLK